MKTDFIERYNVAIQKNRSLKNAIFYIKIDNSVFDNEDVFTEGIFITLQNGSYNWTQTHYLGEDDQFSKIVVVDGVVHILSSFTSKEASGWEMLEEEAYDLKEIITPLLAHTLLEEYIDNIKVEVKRDSHYFIELSECYFENLKAEEIKGIRDILLNEQGITPEDSQVLNEQIETIQSRVFLNSNLEIVINHEGYLVQFKESYRYTDAITHPETITIDLDYQLKDYNLRNPLSLFPNLNEMKG